MVKQIKETKTKTGGTQPIGVNFLKTAYIFVGPPVVGKDAQTDAFAENLGIPVFKTGPALKKMVGNDPHHPESLAIKRGDLANDGTTIWLAKMWIFQHRQHAVIMLNGIPRNTNQMIRILEALHDHGFKPKVIWFTTPMEICIDRPYRDNRPEDTPKNRVHRMQVYAQQTLPMRKELRGHGISEKNGNLLFIDNSNIQKHDVAEQIILHFGLPYMVSQLFPQTVPKRAESVMTVSER